MSFTHLHAHTGYSLLDGANKIKDYVARVKELGMTSAAITDHGNMYGAVNFYKTCKKEGIKPIIGCEVYVSAGDMHDKTPDNAKMYHLVLLAENDKGYYNLMQIVSKAFVEGFYYKPRVDMDTLRQFHEGIIASSACLAGNIPKEIVNGNYQEAKRVAEEYQDIFGKDNFFLELQDTRVPEQKVANQGILRLSEELGIDMIATNDIHYTRAEDAEAHDVLLCIQTKKTINDENRMRYEGGQYYVKSEDEMRELFPYAPEAIENTQKIADRCNVELEFGKYHLPQYDVPEEGKDAWEYLNKKCFEGLHEKYDPVTPELEDRLNYELNTIHDLGFVDYFLITADFINAARDRGIPVGPGRGSAAGSIVSYTLGITKLDPIKNDLLFERFLNPERVSMPDIDVDFCFERRQEVIDYVIEKYGKDRVSQIITFGTLGARGVIRDAGRALDLPYATCDKIAKMIPQELGITLSKALEESPDFKAAYENDPEWVNKKNYATDLDWFGTSSHEEELLTKPGIDIRSDEKKAAAAAVAADAEVFPGAHHLIDVALKLEGLPRHSSMHAAGVVISNKPVNEYVPLSRASDGQTTTEYSMTEIEELGLLKVDFLGLRTLTVIQNAIDDVKRGLDIDVDIDHIDLNDPNVLGMISRADTEGVFQLESGGMKNFMKDLKPSVFEDVVAGISLYRPGPMDFIPQYIKNKEDPEHITYPCPQLEPILGNTYGCIIYQEQVMRIVQELGGFSLGRADLIRRAMSKKKMDVMQKERQNFVYGNADEGIEGCLAKGISEDVANEIWDNMISFAKYAFNKSHAAAYAVVGMQTAYLKCYYPSQFMAALMTSVLDNTDKITEYIQECRDKGMDILPPDINKSGVVFQVENTKDIRFSITAIKNVGKPVVEAIIEERGSRGDFKSFDDFAKRMNGKCNKGAIETMIKAGCFDAIDTRPRGALLNDYEGIIKEISDDLKKNIVGQMSLFDTDFSGDMGIKTTNNYIPEPGFVRERDQVDLAYEKEVTGIYITGHPLDDPQYRHILKTGVTMRSSDFVKDPASYNGQKVVIAGLVKTKDVRYPKNGGDPFLNVTIEDKTGDIKCKVWGKQLQKLGLKDVVVGDKIFAVGYPKVNEDFGNEVAIQDVKKFDDIPKSILIKFETREDYEAARPLIKELWAKNKGVAAKDGNLMVMYDGGVKGKTPIYATPDLYETMKQLPNVSNSAYYPESIAPLGQYWTSCERIVPREFSAPETSSFDEGYSADGDPEPERGR